MILPIVVCDRIPNGKMYWLNGEGHYACRYCGRDTIEHELKFYDTSTWTFVDK